MPNVIAHIYKIYTLRNVFMLARCKHTFYIDTYTHIYTCIYIKFTYIYIHMYLCVYIYRHALASPSGDLGFRPGASMLLRSAFVRPSNRPSCYEVPHRWSQNTIIRAHTHHAEMPVFNGGRSQPTPPLGAHLHLLLTEVFSQAAIGILTLQVVTFCPVCREFRVVQHQMLAAASPAHLNVLQKHKLLAHLTISASSVVPQFLRLPKPFH